ncbi:hypothetical protein ScPMuIL_007415 [Solemya velum]
MIRTMEVRQALILMYRTYLLLLTVGTILAKETRVSLDAGVNSTDSNCSTVLTLESGDETTVTSSGRAHNGYCGVSFYSVDDERYTCNSLCITVKNSRMITCDAKLKFTAVHFSKDKKDDVREFDCRHPLKDVWCMTAKFLRLELIESYRYAYLWDRGLYGFQLDVSPQCEVAVEDSNYLKAMEDKSSKAKTEGIVVACCLASVFLIVLGIMYCYYKQKPISGPPTDVHMISKGSFAGFRAKLNLGRFTHNSSKNQNTEPQLSAFRPKHSPQTAVHCEEKTHSIEDRNESPFLTPPEGTAEETDAIEEAANEETVTIELEEVPLCDTNEKNQNAISN